MIKISSTPFKDVKSGLRSWRTYVGYSLLYKIISEEKLKLRLYSILQPVNFILGNFFSGVNINS